MSQLDFNRNIHNLLAEIDENWLWIHCGWSMPISRTKAVEYVKYYNTEPNTGFYEHEGKVILTHNHGKITFSAQESSAIVQLIKAAYPEA